MPRPQAFTAEQLLAAARQVFLERGVLATRLLSGLAPPPQAPAVGTPRRASRKGNTP